MKLLILFAIFAIYKVQSLKLQNLQTSKISRGGGGTPTGPPKNCVWLYQHSYYRGWKDELCGNTNKFIDIAEKFGSSHSKEYSSIKIGAHVSASIQVNRGFFYLYENKAHFKYKELFWTNSYNDEITRVQVGYTLMFKRDYEIRFYPKIKYGGDSYRFPFYLGRRYISQPGSMEVGKYVGVELYLHKKVDKRWVLAKSFKIEHNVSNFQLMKLVRDGFIIREARGYLRSDYEKYE